MIRKNSILIKEKKIKRSLKMALFILLYFMSNILSGQKSINNFNYELNDSTKLTFIISEFDSTKYKIGYCRIEEWSGVCLIDNKPIFGTDFSIPKFIIEKGFITIKDKVINLDVSNMYQKPIISSQSIKKTDGGFYVNSAFSDGAGIYIVQWKIIKNISIRTIISNDEKLWSIEW